MNKPKIIIVGGGIGGLSCATALAETDMFDVSIFESDIIGGQASSKKSDLCNTEISWRVFLGFYDNLMNIVDSMGIRDNFYSLKDGDVCINNNNSESVLKSIITKHSFSDLSRIARIIFLCKERAINYYHNINSLDYYKNSEIMKIIIGPYYGLEPSKVTLSTVYKFTYNYFQNSKPTLITKNATSDSLFKPWGNYLKSKNVKIYEKHSLNSVITNEDGKITKLIINNNIYKSDEIVFACSLRPLSSFFNKNTYLSKTNICRKINTLTKGQQFYISVNFYWKHSVIKDRKCHIYTFTNGWIPIIIRRFILTDYVKNNCNENIKEVWNIGLADYLLGNYVKKFTSQCTFEEIIYEIKMNLINSEHFKKYFDFKNNSWDYYFYGYEFDDRYYKKLPNTEKFSINKGIEQNLLNNNEEELGNNIFFSAYYVKNSVGGASMETSCEIGLTTADLICKKYNVKNSRKPIYKTRNYIFFITLPLILLDYFLYKLNLKPITDFINPILLLIIYLIIIVFIILYFMKIIWKNYLRNYLQNL